MITINPFIKKYQLNNMAKFYLSWIILVVCHNTLFWQYPEGIEMFLWSLDPEKNLYGLAMMIQRD